MTSLSKFKKKLDFFFHFGQNLTKFKWSWIFFKHEISFKLAFVEHSLYCVLLRHPTQADLSDARLAIFVVLQQN